MKTETTIAITQLCIHFEVEISFFEQLTEIGLIEIIQFESKHYLDEDNLNKFEKIIRLHKELNLNFESIDVVFHLLNKIEAQSIEITQLKNKVETLNNLIK